MRLAERDAARFYFALPRLVWSALGRSSARTETNWCEANVVGTAVMLVSYLAIAHDVADEAAGWKNLLWLLTAVVLTWVFWLLVLYIDAQIIKLLRAAGILVMLSNARAQSVLIGATTTVLACDLLNRGPWLNAIGATWITAVAVNLLAALLLSLRRDRSDQR